MNTESTMMPPVPVSYAGLLDAARGLGPFINQYTEEGKNDRRIPRPVFNALKEAGLFRLFLPKSLGGFELDPVSTAKLVEEVAGYNTAAAWSMMVANTATWWCSRLSEQGIEELYNDGPDTFIAGVFHPPMRATVAKGGYLINGRSPLTSNVHEAHWIFVTALVMEQGQMKMHNGIPVMLGVFMKPGDCEVIDTWHTIGMQATDSNDIAAKDAFVPEYRTYPLAPIFEPNQHYRGLLYQFPAVGASIASLITPVALAVARNAINELKAQAEKKIPFGSAVSIRERGAVQRKLGMAEAFVQSGRAYLYQSLAEYWKKTQAGEKTSMEERAALLLAVTHTNQTCLQAVDMMYSALGSSGIYNSNKISQYFLDAQVIRQHGFSNESRYETAGQIYFGLQPDFPVIVF